MHVVLEWWNVGCILSTCALCWSNRGQRTQAQGVSLVSPHWELVITMAVWSIRFSVGIYILPMNNEKQIGDHCCEVIAGFRINTRAAEVQIPGHILVAARCSVGCLHSSALSRCFFIADCSHQLTEHPTFVIGRWRVHIKCKIVCF